MTPVKIFSYKGVLKLVTQLENEPEVNQIGELPEDIPFAIPEKWKWRAFSEAVKSIATKPYQIKSSEVLSEGFIPVVSQSQRSIDGYCNDEDKVIPTELLPIVIFGDHTKVAKYVAFPFIVGADGTKLLRPIQNDLTCEFLYFFVQFMSQKIRNRGYSRHFQFLKSTFIPIPPLKEQVRITARLKKLKPLIEKYGQEQIAIEKLENSFPSLLRLSLLKEAIQGKLVPQLESEPIVTQVGAKPQDVPFIIPNKWKWVQLKTVGKVIGGGTPRTNVPEYWDNGDIPWFTPADLGKITSIYVGTSARKITAKGLANSSAIRMPRNSVLFSSRAPIGYIALAEEACCTNQGCKSFVANESFIMPMWAYWVLKARTPDIVSRASGTTFKEISGRGMGDTWIPLPPIPEQNRIITRIKELFDIAKVIQ